MVRPMWLSPRYNEADTSDALQSDVMRFMAILALCLVAIFALVQSLPLRPVEPVQAPQPAPVDKASAAPQPVTVSPATLQQTAPSPGVVPTKPKEPLRPMPQPKPEETLVEQPPAPVPSVLRLPESVEQIPKPEQYQKSVKVRERLPPPAPEVVRAEQPQPAPENSTKVSTSDTQEGLSLRFASDAALLALVAQRRVDVFGWVGKTAWKLSSERGLLSFVSAPVPKRFHSMTPDTVPSAIALSLHQAVPRLTANTITWGVTLPADTTHQLEQLVNKHTSGTLVIHANGRVRFESAG